MSSIICYEIQRTKLFCHHYAVKWIEKGQTREIPEIELLLNLSNPTFTFVLQNFV